MTFYDGHHGQIETLTEQFELFSNLCLGRNYICRKSINESLSMSALMTNIWNPQLSKGNA